MQPDGLFSCSKESTSILYNEPDESNSNLKSSSFHTHAYLYFLIVLPISGYSTKFCRHFLSAMLVIVLLSSSYNLWFSFYKRKVTALKMMTSGISEALETTHRTMRRHSSENYSRSFRRRDVNSHVRYSTNFVSIREEFRHEFLKLSIYKEAI
jgi:hypothetical protein